MHEIYQSFDDDLEVRGVFFYKLRQNGVIGKVLNILTNFLKPGK